MAIATGAMLLTVLIAPQQAEAPSDRELDSLRELAAAYAIDEEHDRAFALLARVLSSPRATAGDFLEAAVIEAARHRADLRAIPGFLSRARALGADPREAVLAEAQTQQLVRRNAALGVAPSDPSAKVPTRDDAIAALRRALEADPQSVWLRVHLAAELADDDPSAETEENGEARRIFFALATEDPERLGEFATYVIERCQKLAANREEAVKFLRRSNELRGSELDRWRSWTRIDGPIAIEPPPPIARVPRGTTSLPAASWHPAPQLRFATYGEVRWIDVGDVDHDLRDDVVVVDETGLLLLRQLSDGTFEPKRIADIDATRVRIADVEHLESGDASLVVATSKGLAVLDPDGEGRWIPETLAAEAPCAGFEVLDFDGDGDEDVLAIRDGHLLAWRNDGFATVREGPADERGRETEWKSGPLRMADASATLPEVPDPFSWLAIEDFDGDRAVDVLVGGSAADTFVMKNRKLGRHEARPSMVTGLRPRAPHRPLLADLDHDGSVDVLWLDAAVAWQRNRGDGTFDATVELPWLASFAGANATLADVDRDGDWDLVAADPAQAKGELVARLGSLLAADSAVLRIGGVAPSRQPPILSDLDQDADLDLVGVSAGSTSIEMRAGQPDPSTHAMHVLLKRQRIGVDRDGSGAIVVHRIGGRITRQFAARGEAVLATGAAEWPDLVDIDWPRAVGVEWPRQILLRDPERVGETSWGRFLLDVPGDADTVYVRRGDRSLQQVQPVGWMEDVSTRDDTWSGTEDRIVRPFRLADGRQARLRASLPEDRGPLIPRTLGGDWKLAPSTPGPFRLVLQEEMPSSGPPGPHGPFRRPAK